MFSIGFPEKSDIEQILRIQNSVLIRNKSAEEKSHISKSGFLVTKLGSEDFEKAIDKNQQENLFLVAKDSSNKVVGYFIAYDMNEIMKVYPQWFSETRINPVLLEKHRILYGMSLASDGSIRGVGRALDGEMFKLGKQKGYTLYIGEICEGPIKNEKSLNIHTQEFGMKKISEYEDREGYKWGIYVKYL